MCIFHILLRVLGIWKKRRSTCLKRIMIIFIILYLIASLSSLLINFNFRNKRKVK
jgi:hypothetical protein